MGYGFQGQGHRSDELDASLKAQADSARRAAAANAEYAQKAEQAAGKAQGLTKESRAVVSAFEGMTAKGETTADALAKVTKELILGDVTGINAAVAALDVLAQRGRIAANQIRETLGAALKGEDLGRFETMARAAFDGTEQGVRRLGAALDVLAEESLRRVGTSTRELATGFSEASTSAINDVDALGATLDRMGIKGEEAGHLLSKSIDQALAASTTEKAVRAVIDRLTDLGAAGALAGDRVAAGLLTAQRKIDDIRAGVNSLGEALRAFGLKTRAELQDTADKLGEAYLVLAGRADVSLQDQAKAFNTWRDAALAATGGVESGQVRLQRVMLENRLAAAGLGDSISSAMDKASRATDKATAAQRNYNSAAAAGIRNPGANTPDGLPKIDSFGDLIRNTPNGGITRTGSGQLSPPDDSGRWVFNTNRRGEGPFGLGVWELTPEAAAAEEAFLRDPRGTRATDPGGFNGNAGYSPFGSYGRSQQAPAPAPVSTRTVTVNLNVGGRPFPLSGAESVVDDFIQQLEDAKRNAGGG